MSRSIRTGEFAEFARRSWKRGLSEKRINNILSVLPKPLEYALDVGLIALGVRLSGPTQRKAEIGDQ